MPKTNSSSDSDVSSSYAVSNPGKPEHALGAGDATAKERQKMLSTLEEDHVAEILRLGNDHLREVFAFTRPRHVDRAAAILKQLARIDDRAFENLEKLVNLPPEQLDNLVRLARDRFVHFREREQSQANTEIARVAAAVMRGHNIAH